MQNRPGGYQFGTFGGVFTPSILTIFGLIMFMRAGFVVGVAGVPQALLILCLSCGITLLTGLSIAAISSNTPVAGGGAYFLISRVLGPGFGTAIGIALFVAQALSVPFYILGFTEALIDSFALAPHWFLPVNLITLVVLFVITWVGAGVAIKFQFLILAVLALSIVTFMTGMALNFDPALFQANLVSHYGEKQNLWRAFAIYFPAVTGIMAGVNMSGDLRDPGKSIPRGTLAAIGLSFVVYGAEIVLFGGLAEAAVLQERPFLLLVTHAWMQLGFLVIAGVFAATLSSAIGSYLGAPRVLQAVAKDESVPMLVPFALGSGSKDEPRRALAATFALALIVLLAAGGGGGGAGLNAVASVVTMVFLYTYGMTNLAAFVESFGANPSFRPRFRFYHWSTALVGAVACLWTALMIDPVTAGIAALVLGALYLLAHKQEMRETYGDARRGFIYQRLRNTLCTLSTMPIHPKNWRPTLLVFSGNPHARTALVTYARWLGANCGIVSLVSILIGELSRLQEQRRLEQERLERFVRDHALPVLPEVVVMEDFDRDLGLFLQAYSVGPIKPNVVLLGWPTEPKRLAPYFRHLRTICDLQRSIVIVHDKGSMPSRRYKRIDCWWRGHQNGSLMVILAHLIMQNREWRGTKLRLLRKAAGAEEVAAAELELETICRTARIHAEIQVIVSPRPFGEVLREQSEDAALVLLGFVPPEAAAEQQFHAATAALLQNMPATLLIYSSGAADLFV